MYLNENKTRVLIGELFTSQTDFLAEWSNYTEQRNLRENEYGDLVARNTASKQRSRQTLKQWLEEGIPRGIEPTFSLCGFLGVDLLALLDHERMGVIEIFAKIRSRLLKDVPRSDPLYPILRMYAPGSFWPNRIIADIFYNRAWTNVDVEYENVTYGEGYSEISIDVDQSVPSFMPVVILAAYRFTISNNEMWRPYGYIIRDGTIIHLAHERGEFQSKCTENDPNRICFETYFGEWPVEFRFTSLHQIHLADIKQSTGRDIVRFSK